MAMMLACPGNPTQTGIVPYRAHRFQSPGAPARCSGWPWVAPKAGRCAVLQQNRQYSDWASPRSRQTITARRS